MNETYASRIDEVRRRAHGRWSEILRSLGVDERILARRNLPCPACGGTDRFQYTDKFGEGNYHCRHCGPGGGFKLLQATLGIGFPDALRRVEGCVGGPVIAPPAPAIATEPSTARMRELARRLWNEARAVSAGDAVDRYLAGRALRLPQVPAVLRCHPALGYFERDDSGRLRQAAQYPALLACIQGADGRLSSLHRTYLQDGHKAPVDEPRKVLSRGVTGAAVRLFEAAEVLAVAEGLETALAVHLATRLPVWAALSAGNLEQLWLPAGVRQVAIYADNDADGGYAGQAAAFALARRLSRDSRDSPARHVRVFLPARAGQDWADVWCERQRRFHR
jgi:putative DNA primase/helicase